jgi:ferredoxin
VTDLLRWPAVGALARHRRARLVLQLPLLAVAVILVLHGLLGPQIAPRNLATVATWVHYRGLLVVALLAVGNLFCTACPMILVRDAARTLTHPARRWPRVLRTKWPALTLFIAVLFTYELFDLWSLPRATAWLLIGYFAAALVVDVVFAGASFCKYICPVGQFSFIASTLSPTELRVRDIGTCRSCRTVDCLRGRQATKHTKDLATKDTRITKGHVVARGCELNLFLPSKVGNLDCTLCLDCVHACPHDNIALASRVPGEELSDDRRRSGIGRLARRPDLAALAVLFTFGALVNAFAMTSPAYRLERWLAGVTGFQSEMLLLGMVFVGALVLLPLVILGAAALSSRAFGDAGSGSVRETALRYSFALVPLGFAVWTAHYLFHLLTGALTIVPVLQSAALDATGAPLAGEPMWTLSGMRPGTVYAIQLGCLLVGTLGSIAVAHRISTRVQPAQSAGPLLPWTAAIITLSVAAAWVLSQPMEMRAVGLQG